MLGRRQKMKYNLVESKGDETVELEPVKKASQFTGPCLWSSVGTGLLICIYFIPSVGLTFYQRWLFQEFHYPLTTVLIHMVVKFLLACAVRTVLSLKNKERRRITMDWKEYAVSVAPTGVFSGVDIGFSNWGLELIKVSLYTMTKSTTVVFILGFAILFKLEKKSWSLCITVTMICLGLILFTYKATEFNVLGFVLLLIASISSGLRWTCVQLLLQNCKVNMKNPVDMIYFMQPWMIVSLLPFVMWIEGPSVITSRQLFRYEHLSEFFYMSFKICVGAFIAFFMEMSEVMVVTYTSSLTLSIAGIFKELFMVVLAVQWNGDKLSAINVIGLIVCLLGITSHVLHKIRTMQPRSLAHKVGYESERQELGEYLINDVNLSHYDYSSESEGEHSDTQVLFDILNRHDR